MFKKGLPIVSAVAAFACVITPTMADASARNWRHNGEKLTETVEIVTHGTFGWQTEQGGFECPTTATVVLHPGSTGTITSFIASSTASCIYSGVHDQLCGVVTVHTATTTNGSLIGKTNPLTIHATKFPGGQYGITITNIETHIDGTGVFCPNITLHGDVSMTENPHGSIVQVEGTLTANFAPVLHIRGVQEPTPAGTYTIET